MSLKKEKENILFLTNGKVAATVNATIKEKDHLRTRKGKKEQSKRRAEAEGLTTPAERGAERCLAPRSQGRGSARWAVPGAVALRGPEPSRPASFSRGVTSRGVV